MRFALKGERKMIPYINDIPWLHLGKNIFHSHKVKKSQESMGKYTNNIPNFVSERDNTLSQGIKPSKYKELGHSKNIKDKHMLRTLLATTASI